MTKEDRCLSRLAIFARYKTFLECGTGKPGGQGQNEKRRREVGTQTRPIPFGERSRNVPDHIERRH